jgi:short-subunit dehydrogenase
MAPITSSVTQHWRHKTALHRPATLPYSAVRCYDCGLEDIDVTDLTDQWILITGASKGLGREMALAFAKAGGNLVLSARNAQLLEEVKQAAEQLGVQCVLLAGDITEENVLQSLAKLGIEKQVDVLVNNAGIVSIEPLENVPLEHISRLLELNLIAPIKLTRALLPMFKTRKSGTIVNINSLGGRKPVLNHAIYCAGKYGLNGFAEALKLEVKGQGIRILNVSPGKMATDLFRSAGKQMDTAAFIPPAEVAEAIVYLLGMSPNCGPAELDIDRMS